MSNRNHTGKHNNSLYLQAGGAATSAEAPGTVDPSWTRPGNGDFAAGGWRCALLFRAQGMGIGAWKHHGH